MSSQTSGYQGFRSFSVQTCTALKPGETSEGRATKFSEMGSHIVTSPQHNRVGRHAFESIATQSMQNVQPSDYHVPDKRGVIANEKPPVQRKFIATSTYLHDFPSYEQELRQVIDIEYEAYERAFYAVLGESTNGNNNSIDLSQVSKVVTKALGERAVARIVESFVSYFDHERSITPDKITWDVFQAAVQHIHSMSQNELGKVPKRLTATSTALSKAEVPKVIPATTPASSYQVDYGRYGDQPLDRPYIRRRGMASTTDDLQPGTHKTTMHIPGYTGFLPRTTHNPDAVAHGSGEQLRRQKDELRLYHTDNVPGYTGHKPVDCKNYRGECRAGSDVMTSTGAAYKPHM